MFIRVTAAILITLSVEVATAGTYSYVYDSLSGVGSNFQFSSNGIASLSDSYGSAAANAQMTAADTGIATYGHLGVESFTSFTTSAYRSALSFAIADVGDSLTISSPAFNGSAGFLFIDYTMDGTISTSGAGSSFVQVAIDVIDYGPGVRQSTNTAYTSSASGTFRAPKTFTFTYGQPFGLDICLGAATGTGIIPAVLPSSGHLTTFECAPGPGIPVEAGSGTGSAAFLNTLVLSGLMVTDSLGNPVNGAQFTSASGTQYGPDGVVPEPSSLLILGPGLAIIAVLRRKAIPFVFQKRF